MEYIFRLLLGILLPTSIYYVNPNFPKDSRTTSTTYAERSRLRGDTPFSLPNNPFLVFDSDSDCFPECILLGDVMEEARKDCEDGGDLIGDSGSGFADAVASGLGIGICPDRPYLDCKVANAAE
jgi:hypothetical protein